MAKTLRLLLLLAASVATIGLFRPAAAQPSLSWQIEQIYSNADTSIQFVVMHEFKGDSGQNGLKDNLFYTIHVGAHPGHAPGDETDYFFPNDLPSTDTAGKRFLIATPGFVALGLLTPDYIVDPAFFPLAGDFNFVKTKQIIYDSVSVGSGNGAGPALPSDGVNALYRDGGVRQNLATNFAGRTATVPPGATAPPPGSGIAVEYYYAAWNQYFVTSFPEEAAALDSGAFNGNWQRTGQTFKVWTQSNAASSPTCRFFSTNFAPKSSHFYTPFPAECDMVKQSPDWQFEAIAFHIQLADANGNCISGTIPLYRLYNNGMGGAPNHRYTTSQTIFNQMIVAGWVFEGNGNTKVFACVPQ